MKQVNVKFGPWNERYNLTKFLACRILAAVAAVLEKYLAAVYKFLQLTVKSWIVDSLIGLI